MYVICLRLSLNHQENRRVIREVFEPAELSARGTLNLQCQFVKEKMY